MDIRFCSKCGAEAVKGKTRCPHCNTSYEGDYEKLKDYADWQEEERIIEENNRKTTNKVVKIVVTSLVVLTVLSFLLIIAAIFVPAFIGYTAKSKAARERAAEKYISYDYEYSDFDDNYIYNCDDNDDGDDCEYYRCMDVYDYDDELSF